MLYLYYPKCTTCGKASHWLAERGLAFTAQWLENPDSSFVARDIKKDNPTEAELRVARQERPAPEALLQHQRPAVPGLGAQGQAAHHERG